jgi:hypothetical protein
VGFQPELWVPVMSSARQNRAVEAALRDVMSNLSRFEAANKVALPKDKSDFPKLVVLDTKDWINLWHAEANTRHASSEAKTALSALRDSIRSGRAIVACTDTNVAEMAEWKDEASREQRMQFLVELSQNYALLPSLTMRAYETIRVIQTRFMQNVFTGGLREIVLRWGFAHALGRLSDPPKTGNPAQDRALELAMLHPVLSVELIAHDIHHASVQSKQAVVPLFDKAVQVRLFDQSLSYDERLRRELSVSFAECPRELIEAAGADPDKFRMWLNTGNNRHEFWLSVPSVDILLRSFLERDKDKRAAIELNDVNDLLLLQLGLPYANVVLTDKRWLEAVRRSKLDQRYNCVALTKLQDLPDALRQVRALD